MGETNVFTLWREPKVASRFRTGVCLHGHTMYSEECLAFLPRYLHCVPGISQIVSHYERGPRSVDFARAYWTPPLTAHEALRLERDQIAGLSLRPLVSLTDHDSIEAGMSLQITEEDASVPVSVEWTAPFARTILHLGIHNLPAASARSWMAAMAAYTAAPNESRLPEMLRELSRIPEVLIVLNHPYWLEEGVQEADHEEALRRVLPMCNEWFHAFELNGTRGWRENLSVIELARQWGRPVISGGDRHGCEPSACLNLTNARSFSEFVSEIRSGHGSVLFMPQYREPMPIRVLEAGRDILRDYPHYSGREHWTDRLFYRGDDGIARSLSALWQGRIPWCLTPVANLLQFFAAPTLKPALRALFARTAEALP